MSTKSRFLALKTIRAKFLALVVPLVLLATIVVFGLFEVKARNDAELRLRDKLDKLAAIQSGVVAESLWNVADEQIKLILAALAIDSDVSAVAVFDEQGELVSSIGDIENIKSQPFFAKKDISYKYNDEIKVIGHLSVALNDSGLQAAAEERMILAGGLAAILLVLVVISALIGNRRTIGIPLERLLDSITGSRDGGLRRAVDWQSNDEIGSVVAAFNDMQVSQQAYEQELKDARDTLEVRVEERTRDLDNVTTQLNKYISPQLYQSILRGDQEVKIDSKRKKLTIFFSDISNFTEITDRLESEELTALLNEYLTEMSKIAQEHGAYFDKFIGDAMMFYFGDPESKGVKEDAYACVRMAIAMQRRLRQLQTDWQDQGLIDQPFEARIGINTGYCTVGNFGSEDRMDYTIIGGEVNLAARMEANADVGGILMAAETQALVSEFVSTEEREAVQMKGFSEPIRTFSVLGIYEPIQEDMKQKKSEETYLNPDIDYRQLKGTKKATAILELKEALAYLKD